MQAPRNLESRTGRSRPPGYFATTIPGLGTLLSGEIAAHQGLDPDHEPGFDGRADIVFFRQRRGAGFQLEGLRTAEDVFAEIGTARSGPPGALASAAIDRTGLEHALSTRARFGPPLRAAMTFRVITRVLDERRFQRTQLRDALTRVIAQHRPRWRIEDPAELEIWVVEHRPGHFISGLRLSDWRMRQHGDGRAAERHGALRPTVAAAMVQLAGDQPGRLLDPFCGAGTIVAEARAAGWASRGSDLDPDAVTIARANVPQAIIEHADALHLAHPDGSFDAVVSNLPFGKQFSLDSGRGQWLPRALAEAARVTRPSGHVVVLVPPSVPGDPPGLTLTGSFPLRLLGVPTRIWVYAREPVRARS